jgi:hypothetical protein
MLQTRHERDPDLHSERKGISLLLFADDRSSTLECFERLRDVLRLANKETS